MVFPSNKSTYLFKDESPTALTLSCHCGPVYADHVIAGFTDPHICNLCNRAAGTQMDMYSHLMQ